MTTKTMWIDGSGQEVGTIWFLIEISNPIKKTERYELRDTPPRKNISMEYEPNGWCGSYNDTSTFGRGVWEVIKTAKNGRIKINEITDRTRLEEFLEESGFPDLLSEFPPAEEIEK